MGVGRSRPVEFERVDDGMFGMGTGMEGFVSGTKKLKK